MNKVLATETEGTFVSLPIHAIARYTTLLAFLAIFATFSIATPTFFTTMNLTNVLTQSALLAFVAIGLTFVVASGGMDLSVAVSFDAGALATVVALQNGLDVLPAVFCGLLAGLCIGAFNGLFIVLTKVNAFLVTLGTLFIVESLQRVFTRGGESIYLSGVSSFFTYLGQGSFLVITLNNGQTIDIKFSLVLLLFVAIGAFILLRKSEFGRKLYAIGSQRKTAYLSGVPVNRYIIYAFILSGIFCALAGILSASVLNSYTPVSGRYYLLDAIGAVFIGSTLHKRGFSTIGGTLVGVLLFGIIANGLNLMGLNFYWQNVAKGLVLLLILIIDASLKNQHAKTIHLPFLRRGNV